MAHIGNKLHDASLHWIEVGVLEDFPRQGARVFADGARDIAIFRTGDDRVFALEDRCPHRGGPLSQGVVYGQRVACPLHNMQIDLESGTAVAPDEGCTAVYPVRIENGIVLLALPR